MFRETRPREVDAYEQWLGCAVDYVVDFPSRDTWADIANPDYFLDAWEGMSRRLVLSLAMLPDVEDADHEAGARGDYDDHFTELGRHLVARGMEDTVVRIGWEFNLKESRYYTDDAVVFRAYWRRIVEAMRSVPGQQFQFTWNPDRGGVDPLAYYPGDAYLDHIGVDIYDATGAPGTYPYPEPCDDACRLVRQREAWSGTFYGGPRGLRFWSAFAREHDKPLALPEWGLWSRPDRTGGGPNPHFLQSMHDFISDPRNQVAYHAYFEYDGDDGEHRLMTTFSEVGDLYRRLMAG